MTTVLTVGGANYGWYDGVGRALGGYCTADGRQRHEVRYSQAMSSAAYDEGLVALTTDMADLVARGGELQIIASSLGAELVGAWLRANAASPTAPGPDQLTRIILIGNPERRFGGVWNRGLGKFGFGGLRQPTPETQYRTDDIARYRDPWANADSHPGPVVKLNWLERIREALQDPHSHYERVDPGNPGVLRAHVGNTRYWVAA